MITKIAGRVTMNKAAQTYAKKGWPVFLDTYVDDITCEVCKVAHTTVEDFQRCTCVLCHGKYSATTDKTRIRDMTKAISKGIVCVRTGSVSGLVAIEITTPAGLRSGAHLEQGGFLPNTLTILAEEGGGYLLYQHPGVPIRSGANRLGPGVHVHADGDYIPMPPSRSRKSGQRLTWLGDSPDRTIAPLHPRILAALRDKIAT
ncbi:bifunctional DNA primase/polymerase [Microbispora bryophytorum]|uniref:bifunctional DNA primase/polymerase n=1 Tax=Microbispora bryophytorum TaxID=1460882 RepID=UPI0033EE276A